MGVSKPRALDLFCGAGGVTRGLQRAGFHVTGVDKKAQPRYCGDDFQQADFHDVTVGGLRNFDFIWASPPCQHYSALKTLHRDREHPALVESVREILRRARRPFVIENVVGAPLKSPLLLCGSMFGLGVRRHRLFEMSWPHGLTLSCNHAREAVPVYGHNSVSSSGRKTSVADQRAAMGIDWMTRDELAQAIPPAYAEYIGKAAIARTARPQENAA